MSEHTKGKLHNHGLIIHIADKYDMARNDGKHNLFARMDEVGTAYQSSFDLQEANAERLVKCWNSYDENEKRDTVMVEALAEIKAIIDGNPEQEQTIKEIVEGCIDELAAIAAAKAK